MESRIGSHRDLVVWRKAMDLAVATYSMARRLPAGERFGLASQITRAAASIPANIAEGNGRVSRREYVYFLYIAQGSLNELETLAILAERLGYVARDDIEPVLRSIGDVGRLLTALRRRLVRPPSP